MNIALVILGSLLTIATIGSGFAKLAKVPAVMESMKSVGVKTNHIPLLALLEIAGGAGLIIGIWARPLGVVSAICLAFYFLGALTSHFRKKHRFAEFGAAFFILIIAFAVSYLQLKR